MRRVHHDVRARRGRHSVASRTGAMATASGITPLPKYKLVFLGVRVRAMRARRRGARAMWR